MYIYFDAHNCVCLLCCVRLWFAISIVHRLCITHSEYGRESDGRLACDVKHALFCFRAAFFALCDVEVMIEEFVRIRITH